MKIQNDVLTLSLNRKNKTDKEFLFFPLSETLFLLPKPAGAYIVDTITGDSLLLGGLFYGLSKYLARKDEEKLMEFMTAFHEGNADFFTTQKKALSIPFKAIEKITISTQNPFSKELWYTSNLSMRIQGSETYNFAVGAGKQLSEVESFFVTYLPEIPIEKIE